MIAVVDYRMGNLASAAKAVEKAGGEVTVAEKPDDLDGAQGIILPGVGAFGDGIKNLEQFGFAGPVRDAISAGTPLLGICIGLELLFEESEEMGTHKGLGILPGRVVRFDGSLKVPHIGWNQLHIRRDDPILDDIPDGSYFYFVHSYYVAPGDESDELARTDYGIHFTSMVGRDNVYGVQFHPEKSQDLGLKILANFVKICRGG
ncbi:imidazole glycerol phosphate synthase subunit HisH [candidate division KSB1 bacterium]